MLTIEQVKKHSMVSAGTSNDFPPDDTWINSTARILYLFGGRLNKLYIKLGLPFPRPLSGITESDVKATIDWETFTEWFNKHDDLSEDNLLSVDEWKDHYSKHPESRMGRDGCLDLIQNQVKDHHSIILV